MEGYNYLKIFCYITLKGCSSSKVALTGHLGSLCLLLIRDHYPTLIYRQETILSKSRTEKSNRSANKNHTCSKSQLIPLSQYPGGRRVWGAYWSGQRSEPHGMGAASASTLVQQRCLVCGVCLWAWLLAMFTAAWLFSLPLTSKKIYPGVFTETVTIPPGSTPMVSIAPTVSDLQPPPILSSPSALEPP